MAVTTKQAGERERRIWKAPVSRARWYWLAFSLALYGGLIAWYIYAHKTQQYPGPLNDPLRLFGILAFILVLSTGAYTLRRRFARSLPGKVQSWLWMHTWIGSTTILIAMLHEDFTRITHDYCMNLGCLTDTYWATGALFALILLVISGIGGRLLDRWQTRIIAHEASSNGIGIARALEERILELEYTVERQCAGKSAPFKQFCLQALDPKKSTNGANGIPTGLPPIAPRERSDFELAYKTLVIRADLVRSLQRQRRAQMLMRLWRSIHMVLATAALLIISYHAVMELLTNVWHFFPPA